MILRFKKGSELEKAVLKQNDIKNNSRTEAMEIVEKHTGIIPSGFGYHWGFGSNYMWSADMANFPPEINEVPGFTHVKKNEECNIFKPNGRTKIGRLIRSEVRELDKVSCKEIEALGIPTHVGNIWSYFQLGKDADGAWLSLPTKLLDHMQKTDDIIIDVVEKHS
ncbi:hypothetical protein BZG01_00080 [Labilibaculum manganireducens]|uniref:Uncharacterized protein n=1 Tax=Labilibaculum manganireducens TaxID=1940525 RepID=A0A2N3IGB8_9BACT|nr:hypothetical protein [Labilibaculum manganireducens]PKQ69370.1 hypothetical protein BZG01_00080 [Labilibaculum manganireducens]